MRYVIQTISLRFRFQEKIVIIFLGLRLKLYFNHKYLSLLRFFNFYSIVLYKKTTGNKYTNSRRLFLFFFKLVFVLCAWYDKRAIRMRRKLVNEAQNSAVVSKINFKKNRTFFNQFFRNFIAEEAPNEVSGFFCLNENVCLIFSE